MRFFVFLILLVMPLKVWCDNGANLVGGSKELKKSLESVNWGNVVNDLAGGDCGHKVAYTFNFGKKLFS